LPLVWAVVWVGGAIFQALPGQNTGAEVAGAINGGAPGLLGRLDASLAGWATPHGTAIVVALVVAEALIGLGALHGRSRGVAITGGFLLALAIWVVPQDVGLLYSGQATDPNTRRGHRIARDRHPRQQSRSRLRRHPRCGARPETA